MSTATKEKPRKRGMAQADCIRGIGPIGPISPIASTGKPTKNGPGKLQIEKCKLQNGAARPIIQPHPGSQPARQTIFLPVERIRASRWQSRRDFPEAEIKQLADSILTEGLLVAITVRRCPDNPADYELIFGERRLRALKLLKSELIRAEIIDRSEAQVRCMMLAESLQRKDLNAIEQARAFKAAIEAGDAPGPTELGRQLGLSQGLVSNRLRLLELPAEVQALVISREIPPSHARELVPVAKYPNVVKEVLATLKSHDGQTGPLYEWREEIAWIVGRVGRNIEKTPYDCKIGKSIPPPKLTDQQREQLEIVTIGEDEEASHYAMNKKLWDEIWKAHAAAVAEKAAQKEAKSTTKATKDAKDGKPKPQTAADLMRIRDEERQKAKERAPKLEQGVWAVAIDWRRSLIAQACRQRQVSPEDLLRLLCYFAAGGTGPEYMPWTTRLNAFEDRENYLVDRLEVRGARGKRKIYAALAAIPDAKVIDEVLDYLADLVWHAEDGPVAPLPDEDVLAIAEQLAIDLAAAWKKEAAGALTERWLNLRNKDDLKELAALWRCTGQGACPGKADLVSALLKVARQQKPSAELLKPKKPKG